MSSKSRSRSDEGKSPLWRGALQLRWHGRWAVPRKAYCFCLCGIFLLLGWGCSSFAVVQSGDVATIAEGADRELRVTTKDHFEYCFLRHQYIIVCDSSFGLSAVQGWGEKRGPYGLVDRGHFEIPASDIQAIELERIHPVRTAAFVAATVGAGVLLYVGVHSIATGGRKDTGEKPSPPAPL